MIEKSSIAFVEKMEINIKPQVVLFLFNVLELSKFIYQNKYGYKKSIISGSERLHMRTDSFQHAKAK